MPPAIPLDSRQERIARALLNASGPVASEALAADLHLTDRVVRYNLPPVRIPAAEALLFERYWHPERTAILEVAG